MVQIVPFHGFRPQSSIVKEFATLPYDVIEEEEARKIIQEQPSSFLKVIKPEAEFAKAPENSEEIYQRGADNLQSFVQNQTIQVDVEKSFYVYSLTMEGRTQVGLVAGVSAQEYKENIIKRHEHTRIDKEIDRAKHISTLNANTGPVFLIHHPDEEIRKIIMEVATSDAEYSFTGDNGVEHKLWKVDQPDTIASLQTLFHKLPALYVADGHHRSAAALRVAQERKSLNPLHHGYEQYNFFLAVIFASDEVKIYPYNRVIQDLADLSPESFLEKLEENFEVLECSNTTPEKEHCFAMFLQGKWYNLHLKSDKTPSGLLASLDAEILQNLVLKPLLGIDNPRKNDRIRFVGGIHGTKVLETMAGENGVAFSLYPVSVEQLLAVSDAGEVMPPKSTWFEPKLLSGLVIKPLEG